MPEFGAKFNFSMREWNLSGFRRIFLFQERFGLKASCEKWKSHQLVKSAARCGKQTEPGEENQQS
jgi:hypothetical protein